MFFPLLCRRLVKIHFNNFIHRLMALVISRFLLLIFSPRFIFLSSQAYLTAALSFFSEAKKNICRTKIDECHRLAIAYFVVVDDKALASGFIIQVQMCFSIHIFRSIYRYCDSDFILKTPRLIYNSTMT